MLLGVRPLGVLYITHNTVGENGVQPLREKKSRKR